MPVLASFLLFLSSPPEPAPPVPPAHTAASEVMLPPPSESVAPSLRDPFSPICAGALCDLEAVGVILGANGTHVIHATAHGTLVVGAAPQDGSLVSRMSLLGAVPAPH